MDHLPTRTVAASAPQSVPVEQRVVRKRIVLIGCGDQRYREYLLQQITETYDIWLVTDAVPTWQARYIVGSTRIEAYRPRDIEEAVANLVAAGHLHGIVSWDERYVILAADVATLFGFRSPGSLGIRGCRDKALGRERLAAAGVPQPMARHCNTAEQAIAFAADMAYPVVVKPRGMGGSIGVALATTDAELRACFTAAVTASQEGAADFRSGALVESFLDGPEISIDGYVTNGVYTPLFVARKTVGMAPHFEEIAHVVDSNDLLMIDSSLKLMLQSAHVAIDFEDGITHTEIKLTHKGPVIVEINGRLGGDLIPWLATLACGWKPGLIAGQVAAGDPVAQTPEGGIGTAAITFQYPDHNMTVAQVSVPQPRRVGTASGKAVALARPGERIGLPPTQHLGRAGYAIATGSSSSDSVALSATLASEIKIFAQELTLKQTGI